MSADELDTPMTRKGRPTTFAKGGVIPAKTPADPVTDTVVASGEHSVTGNVSSGTTITMAVPGPDASALRAALRAELRAELLAEITAEREQNDAPKSLIEQPQPSEGTTLIHFVADGITIGGRVFYRGEEYQAPANAEWLKMTGNDQVLTYGKRFFRPGPWDGDGFDLDDPSLTKTDREKLLAITRKRQAALAELTT